MSYLSCVTRSVLLLVLVVATTGSVAGRAFGQEAQWIWSPQHEPGHVPHVACHFRKTIVVRSPQQGQISIVADDSYDLFVNGRKVGSGESSERFQDHNVSRFLNSGRNIIAIRVNNTRGATAGVAARVMIKGPDDDWNTYSTDQTWKTNLRPLPLWNTALYNDGRWVHAAELGRLGETPPWDVREEVAESERGQSTERFKIADEFKVEQLIVGDHCGSLIAMTFNEFGHLIASREGGPLILIFDDNSDGQLDTVRDYCTKVENTQGILALNGEVFVTADGPDGAGLYRLRDLDRDGLLEDVKILIRFGESMAEHGAHGLALGPDGLIYVVVGNFGASELEFDENSPQQHIYEGDLLRPRYEDPSGHATGMRAPGGIVLRTDLEGSTVELYASGFRNAYDLAFDREGELFVHDSDMETDIGTPWYRPNRLYHVTPGAEFGWRSGWAKFPEYYSDALPGILDTGRGSPTGCVVYNHFAYPTRYHGTIFLGDWSEGRILAVSTKRSGASYTATPEVFLEGRPLNVTDLAVGPSGALYFSTGGRGTEGGVYRVVWTGTVPDAVSNLGQGMSRAIRQPQLDTAWSRQEIAQIQASLGEDWGKQLRGVARSSANPWYYRCRALELMQLFGPSPTPGMLVRLSKDGNEIVRAKATELMGLHSDDQTPYRLRELLQDPDRHVRRTACEALVESGQTAPFESLEKMLTSDDRYEVWAARRVLEQSPVQDWREQVLTSDQHRVFIQGSMSLVVHEPSREHSLAVAERFYEMLGDFITDKDFIDLLRLLQLALQQGDIGADDIRELCDALGEEFPSSDNRMNRELIRLLAYLQVDAPIDRYLEFLRSDADHLEKLHLAMHLRYLENGWTVDRRMELLEFYEAARRRDDGGAASEYLANVQRDFGRTFPPEDGLAVLATGQRWPEAAVGVLYTLPDRLDQNTTRTLMDLDHRLVGDTSATALRAGILAVLARAADEESLQYLRHVWETEPERRETAALGLAQFPGDTNWTYLVKSLPILEGPAATDVLRRLHEIDLIPQTAEPYRQVILHALGLSKTGTPAALELLSRWTGQPVLFEEGKFEDAIAIWQDWFAAEYPDAAPPVLPIAAPTSRWTFEELSEHLAHDTAAAGSPEAGARAYTKARCDKCHRFDGRGESLGPDLTGINKRFMKKEVLQSIVYPSHIISDQYAAKTVVTRSGRTFVGIVSTGPLGRITVLDNRGDKHSLAEADIETIAPNRQSAMPEGLLDSLTLVEISDLFAYLGLLPAESVARRDDGTTRR